MLTTTIVTGNTGNVYSALCYTRVQWNAMTTYVLFLLTLMYIQRTVRSANCSY